MPEVVAARSIDADGEDPNADLFELYDAQFIATWRRVLKDRRRPQDIGEIPTIADELQSERSYYNFRGIKPLFSTSTRRK